MEDAERLFIEDFDTCDMTGYYLYSKLLRSGVSRHIGTGGSGHGRRGEAEGLTDSCDGEQDYCPGLKIQMAASAWPVALTAKNIDPLPARTAKFVRQQLSQASLPWRSVCTDLRAGWSEGTRCVFEPPSSADPSAILDLAAQAA